MPPPWWLAGAALCRNPGRELRRQIDKDYKFYCSRVSGTDIELWRLERLGNGSGPLDVTGKKVVMIACMAAFVATITDRTESLSRSQLHENNPLRLFPAHRSPQLKLDYEEWCNSRNYEWFVIMLGKSSAAASSSLDNSNPDKAQG